MPRPPKPSSIQLIIRAKPEWEVEFRAFKELCARNGIEYSKEIYESNQTFPERSQLAARQQSDRAKRVRTAVSDGL